MLCLWHGSLCLLIWPYFILLGDFILLLVIIEFIVMLISMQLQATLQHQRNINDTVVPNSYIIRHADSETLLKVYC